MFGRNKKINDNLDLILDKLNWLDIKNVNNSLNQNSKDIVNIDKKIEKLEEKITEVLDHTQIEANFMRKLSETFASAMPLSTIAEAEERMQILSDRIEKLENDKKTLIHRIGGLVSGNSRLKEKNRILTIDKRKLLKEFKNYKKSGGYIPKILPPVKPKPQKTRLKNRVRNYQARNILKEITEEKEQTQDV